MGLDERIKDSGYRHWIKVGLGLSEVKGALETLTGREMSKFHDKMITAYGLDKAEPCTNSDCNVSNIDQRTGTFQTPCPNGICNNLLKDILEEHTQKKHPKFIHFANSDCQKWVSNPWEVAKVYMLKLGSDKKKVTGPETTDISGLLNLMSACSLFRKYCEIRSLGEQLNIRNKVFHSAKMSLEESNEVNQMISFLESVNQENEDDDVGPEEITGFENAILSLKKLLDVDLKLTVVNRNQIEKTELEMLLTRMNDLQISFEETKDNQLKIMANYTLEFVRKHLDLVSNPALMKAVEHLDIRLGNVEGRLDQVEQEVKECKEEIGALGKVTEEKKNEAKRGLMTKETQRRVTSNSGQLANGMRVEDILAELIAAGILTVDERARILLQGTHRQKTEYFLTEILVTKPEWTFNKLVSILNANDKECYAQVLLRPLA